MKRRRNIFMIISGTRGTGKTTAALSLINATDRATLIINPNRERAWENIAHVRSISEMPFRPGQKRQFSPAAIERGQLRKNRREEMLKVMEFYLARARHATIVIDDARELFQSRLFVQALEAYTLAGRQNDIDIICIVHSLGQIPPALIPYLTHLILKRSPEASERFYYKLPRAKEVLAAQEEVNQGDFYDQRVITL